MSFEDELQKLAEKLAGPGAKATVFGGPVTSGPVPASQPKAPAAPLTGSGATAVVTPARYKLADKALERVAAETALDEILDDIDDGTRYTPGNVIDIVEKAINAARAGDDTGTLRRKGNRYAFAYGKDNYLLVDTNPIAPAYKVADRTDRDDLLTWTVVSKP